MLDRALALPDPGTERLREAMRYSVLGAGKRLRPTLVYLTGESLGAPLESLDAPAAAVELIHVYSLVHDDLPAMDDDDLRRGRPTCHKAFDEGTAVLVGDALQALAFAVLANEPLRGSTRAGAAADDPRAGTCDRHRRDGRRSGDRSCRRRPGAHAWRASRTCTGARPAH